MTMPARQRGFGAASGPDSEAESGEEAKRSYTAPRSDRPSPSVEPYVSLQAGDVIGERYEITGHLDQGGMGALWHARNIALDKQVVVKLIRPDLNPEHRAVMVDRLLMEARASAKLDHPAILRTLDYGTTEEVGPYIVMELLAGEDLASVLERRGRVIAPKALQTLLPIAHGLVAAHEKGIIHRDVKPENIYFAQMDRLVQPKLIDFGIARVDKRFDKRITTVGAMIGSPAYMSPEAAVGGELDHRADIWSFCVVLYEAVSGHLPFDADNFHLLLRAITDDEPVALTDYGVGDDELWSIIARGLAKDPADRWQTMRDLGMALAAWLLDRGVHEDVCGTSLATAWFDERASSLPGAFDTLPPMRSPLASSPSGSWRTASPSNRMWSPVAPGSHPPADSGRGHAPLKSTADQDIALHAPTWRPSDSTPPSQPGLEAGSPLPASHTPAPVAPRSAQPSSGPTSDEAAAPRPALPPLTAVSAPAVTPEPGPRALGLWLAVAAGAVALVAGSVLFLLAPSPAAVAPVGSAQSAVSTSVVVSEPATTATETQPQPSASASPAAAASSVAASAPPRSPPPRVSPPATATVTATRPAPPPPPTKGSTGGLKPLTFE